MHLYIYVYIYIYIYGDRELIPARKVLLPAPPVRGRETSVCRNPDAMETCMSPHHPALIVKYPPPPFLPLARRIQTQALYLPKVHRPWAGSPSPAWLVMSRDLLKCNPPQNPSPDGPASQYGHMWGWNFNSNGSGSLFSCSLRTENPVYGGGKLLEKSFEKVTGEGNYIFGWS